MKKWALRLVLIAVIGLGLAYGGILLWTEVINPPEDKLSSDDLAQVLDETTSIAPVDTEPVDSSSIVPPDSDVTGNWVVADGSTLGYRVKEVLGGVDTEGVGRTNKVTGAISIEGTTLTAAEFTVDVASIESDSSRRDEQFRGRIMDTASHPLATFVLGAPAELGSIPREGEQIDVEVSGDLTLRGTTRPVAFVLTAEYSNGRIGVFGNIPIVFTDYGIPNPSNPFVRTGDDVLL